MSRRFWPQDMDAVWMTPLKVFGNIRSIEKSVHLLVVSPAKLALSPEFRQTSPARIFM
jgi:hypothetical protein